MKTIKLKTNINCSGCVAKVTPTLNGITEIKEWNIDTGNKDKILEVVLSEDADPNAVLNGLKSAGFEAMVLPVN